MKSNGVKHITSAPYHPATNGLAERSVQTFKQALRSMEESSKPMEEKLAKFLITYRNTPHSTTGESPAQLVLGRPIRTRLDLVKPNLNRKMVIKQQEQSRKSASAKNRATRQLEVGDTVMARDYRGNLKWRSGKVIERTGPLMYKIEVTSGVIWRRHIDQLLPTEVKPSTLQDREQTVNMGVVQPEVIPSSSEQTLPIVAADLQVQQGSNTHELVNESATETSTPQATASERRYPGRVRKPPVRLDL
jgi:hypothetical protein